MLIVPADNQWLVLPDAVSVVSLYTDAYRLSGLNRASAILTVTRFFGATAPANRELRYVTQTSLDGVNWVNGGPNDDTDDATGAGTGLQVVDEVHGVFIRFFFVLEITTPSGTAGVLFSLHLNLDKK